MNNDNLEKEFPTSLYFLDVRIDHKETERLILDKQVVLDGSLKETSILICT